MKALENRKRSFFTTARIIHDERDDTNERDWLWVNSSLGHRFDTEDEAQSLANLANGNGEESGMNVRDYPYFVVKVTQTSTIEKVQDAESN